MHPKFMRISSACYAGFGIQQPCGITCSVLNVTVLSAVADQGFIVMKTSGNYLSLVLICVKAYCS